MDRLHTFGAATAIALLLAGCGGHSSSKKGSTTAPVNTAPVNTNNPPPGTAITVSAPAGGPTAARIGPDAVALALDLAVSGGGAAQLTGLTLTAAGTLDESSGLGALKVVGDDNKNGLVDAGERVMASVAAPAFSADDGTIAVTFTQSITIASGASLRLIVAVDASATGAAAVAKVGKTVELRVAAAGDVTATSNGQAITPAGTFPVSSGPVTLFLHDHLLISEVVPQPTAAEYIEIFNPTGETIDLTNYYLTDYTLTATPPHTYQQLPAGGAALAPTSTDWLVRFPAGATIAPGQVKVIAMDGAAFPTAFPGKTPDFSIRGATAQAPQMLTLNTTTGVWSAVAPAVGVGLTNTGEPVILFFWDGQSDLVQDVDYVYYGGTSPTNANVEKTGASVDGPDADTTPTPYLPDTPGFQQSVRGSPVPTLTSNGAQRIEFTEGAETSTGGNGITGHDETSEDWSQTFIIGAATPGVP